MSVVAFILFLVAAVLFGVRSAGVQHPRWELTNAGLCIFVVGWIVQLMTTSHPLHF